MTRTKWFLSFAILGLLLLGGALFLWRGSAEKAQAPSASAPPAASQAEADSFRAAPPLKRVMELYERESARVGKIDPDPKATQKRLELAARELKPEEIAWLESQALDTSVDMDARVFAVYLMGLSSQPAAIQSLFRVAMKPVPVTKNDRHDSEERAQRMLSVEGMCTPDNCKIPEAIDQLIEVVSLAQDEWVRDRANRCLQSCKYGKPVQEQDKEALRKLRESGAH